MAALGENIISASGLPPFFKVVNPQVVDAPDNRKGDALRTCVRSLSGFQKEALIRSAKTGDTWRLVIDEGPYLNGHDAACCPLAFLSVGMVASFMNEIMAYAEQQNVLFASPLNGLMRGQLDSLFKLSKNEHKLKCHKATELDGSLLPDPKDLFQSIEAQDGQKLRTVNRGY